MNPVLYRADERSFRTFGLGEISDAYKVTVTRERNGNYDLYIKYPVNGHFASVFKEEMKIKSDAGRRTKWQTFEINRIVKNSSEHIEIYARHISMRTSDIALKPIVKASNITAEAALRLWKDNLVGDDVFDVSSDIQTTGNISWEVDKVGSARKALGGVSGSILDVFGGEYEFDNNLIILHKQMGRKAPTVLEYGRNLLSVEEERLLDGNYTSIYPFARYTPSSDGSSEESKEVLVTLPEHIIDSSYLRLYAQRRISLVDFSGKFDDKHPPTAEKLRSLAQSYIKSNNIGAPKISTEVSYVDLSQTLDYQDFGVMEEVELCDIIPLYYPQFDITTTTEKVVKVVYDVYTDSNEEITLGTIGQSLSSSMTAGIADRLSVIEERQASIESTLPQYLISGTGNKIWYETPAKNVEHKIGDTWFEKNGQYQRMYIWNGSFWEKRLDTEDIDRVQREVEQELESVNAKMEVLNDKTNKKVSDLLEKSNATQELAEVSKRLAQEAINTSNSTGQELSLYRQDNEQNLSILKTQTAQIDGKAGQALNKANQTALETSNLIANLRTDLNGKVSLSEFQQLRETAQLYERILGSSESDISRNASRLVMSSEIFQTEVGKYVTDDNNLIVNSMSMSTNTLVNASRQGVEVFVNDGVFTIKAQGLTSYNFSGFTLPIYVKKIYRGETYTLGFKYRIRQAVDTNFVFVVKNHKLNKSLLSADLANPNTQASDEWQEFQQTFTVQEDFVFGEDANYPFYIYLAKNGWIEFKEPILVRGSRTGVYKPSQFDDAYKQTKEAKELAENAQIQAIKVAEKAEEAKKTSEATRAQMTLLSNSWSVKTLNGPGDVLGAINLNPDGSVKINEGLISVGEKTYIKNGVIKSSMIGNAQINTAHIGEIDASQARIINISAKNIVADGLTANVIRGGKLSSLNGVTDFDLQTGWIEMNKEGVGIVNHFSGRPIQYLVFGAGAISNKPGSYTALMSNSNGRINMDDGSAGIQIWNTNDNTTAVNLYGDEIAMMYNANDPKGIIFDNVKNEIRNVETLNINNTIWIKGTNLVQLFNLINANFEGIERHFQINKLGRPGRYKVSI
jgi:phage minor structural protein, N-terminal domain protein|nr:MAG TPA: tail protein [Caudoviricetes sp.]